MRYFILILVVFLTIPVITLAQDTIRLKVDSYKPEAGKKDTAWSRMGVKSDHTTEYTLMHDAGGEKVIKAESNNAAGGLIYKIQIDPNEYPVIEWRWKVNDVINNGNLKREEGDDYPARIYITFDYDKSNLSFGDRIKYSALKTFTSHNIPLRSINYIWANQAKKGTVAPNPFTDWVYMIAVQSGNRHADTWMVEKRNILEDYRTAFGEEPPAITGVAIMTDSDNTGNSATAYYGDIIFKKSGAVERSK